jgi:hypothetical protein
MRRLEYDEFESEAADSARLKTFQITQIHPPKKSPTEGNTVTSTFQIRHAQEWEEQNGNIEKIPRLLFTAIKRVPGHLWRRE